MFSSRFEPREREREGEGEEEREGEREREINVENLSDGIDILTLYFRE